MNDDRAKWPRASTLTDATIAAQVLAATLRVDVVVALIPYSMTYAILTSADAAKLPGNWAIARQFKSRG